MIVSVGVTRRGCIVSAVHSEAEARADRVAWNTGMAESSDLPQVRIELEEERICS
jgi:hypothetical protein